MLPNFIVFPLKHFNCIFYMHGTFFFYPEIFAFFQCCAHHIRNVINMPTRYIFQTSSCCNLTWTHFSRHFTGGGRQEQCLDFSARLKSTLVLFLVFEQTFTISTLTVFWYCNAQLSKVYPPNCCTWSWIWKCHATIISPFFFLLCKREI